MNEAEMNSPSRKTLCDLFNIDKLGLVLDS